MIDFGVARDKLAGMESAKELADFFQAEGVKGVPGDASSCAIAVWMQETTGRKDISVSQEEMWTDGYGLGRVTEHTGAMKEFTVLFDERAFPELVDRTWEGYYH